MPSEQVTREEFDELVYRVAGLQDMVERVYAALGVGKGEPITKDSE